MHKMSDGFLFVKTIWFTCIYQGFYMPNIFTHLMVSIILHVIATGMLQNPQHRQQLQDML